MAVSHQMVGAVGNILSTYKARLRRVKEPEAESIGFAANIASVRGIYY
jgi:hypothetical protein